MASDKAGDSENKNGSDGVSNNGSGMENPKLGSDSGMSGVTEGSTTVYFPTDSPEEVFYNPVQEFNRDLSIAVIQQFLTSYKRLPTGFDKEKKRRKTDQVKDETEEEGPGQFRILEALSATGLRSIRYAKEIKCPGESRLEITANDLSKRAYESIKRNVELNGVDLRSEEVRGVVIPNHSDATMVMYQSRTPDKRFDVVDLDPYGAPSIFLDGAVQSVAEGGLLCVTATDMAVLAGNAPETCYTKYGALSLRSKNCHEMGLRILLQSIESQANRYGRYIVPLLSMSIDFYVRVFVRVYTSQKVCKSTTSKLGHVYQCTGCESFTLAPLGRVYKEDHNLKYKLMPGPPVGRRCRYCGRTFQVGGPIWIDPIHQEDFVDSLLTSVRASPESGAGKYGTRDRMMGMLNVVAEELNDVPLYYDQDRLYKMMKVGSNKLTLIRSVLMNAGYRVSLSHANRMAVKTDAPNDFVWRMMRAIKDKNTCEGRKEHKGTDVAVSEEGDQRKDAPVWHNLRMEPEADPEDDNCEAVKESRARPISFELHPDANPDSRQRGVKRFAPNPLPNWGPKMKAHTTQADMDRKRKQNQGKYTEGRNKKNRPDPDMEEGSTPVE